MPVPATLREATRTVLLPARADAVARGRHLLAADLRERGLGATLADDAELVVSELLANAIRHARPLEGDTVRILWRLLPGGGEDWPGVEIAVVDGGAPWFPRVEEPPTDVDSGRGLGIVRTLTSEWGVEGAGTTHQLVWAVLRDRPRAGAG